MECHDPPFFDLNDTRTTNYLNTLFEFRDLYNTVHRYISVVLCVFGILANSVHIWVLTRPRMRKSSVHTVLICIAVSDIGTMISYLIYMTRFEFMEDRSGYPYAWALFLKFHVILSIACHAITLYLVVLMAVIRWSAMNAASSKWLRTEMAGIAAVTIAFSVFVLCIPTLLAHQINAHRTVLENGVIFRYSIGFSDMMLTNNCFLMKANLWLTGILLKAIPCFLLFWFTIALIQKLRENREKRKMILKVKEDEKAKRKGDLTTYMLLFMASVFLITELPQGFMAVLNAIYTSQFHGYVYLSLADVLDLLSLVNCYVAFLVYICTCSRYRQTLLSILPNASVIVSALTTRQNTMKASSRFSQRNRTKDKRYSVQDTEQLARNGPHPSPVQPMQQSTPQKGVRYVDAKEQDEML